MEPDDLPMVQEWFQMVCSIASVSDSIGPVVDNRVALVIVPPTVPCGETVLKGVFP